MIIKIGKEVIWMERKQTSSNCKHQEKITVPIDKNAFEIFITQSGIFEKTKAYMWEYLQNWYEESASDFIECMRADFETVRETYHFYNGCVAIAKDLERELDYINCWIYIRDEEDDICCDYRAMYDYDLVCFDDTLG